MQRTSIRPVTQALTLTAALAVVLSLSGCISARPRTAAPRPQASAGGERYSSVKGVAVHPLRAETAAHEAFQFVNEERTRRGMLPLARRPELDKVAMAHARDLFQMNRLDHISSDGRRLENRMARLSWVRAGENLARNKGYDSPSREAVRGWIASPKHYENMFRSDFSQTGMAAVYDPDSGFTYFVQVFVVPV